MTEQNRQLAQMFRQIAALLDEQGVPFKPNAYRRAAQVVEDFPKDAAEMGDEKELKKQPGIGEAISSKIREFVETGHIHFLDTLLAEQGGLPAELMAVDNLGPKRVRQLQALGVTTVAGLIKAAEEGKLRDLPRMSDVIEAKILESAKHVTERSRRFPREEILHDVETIIKTLQGIPTVERAEVAGSYRRKKATVGDIDIIVVTKDPEQVADAIAKLPSVKGVVAKGEKKVSFDLQSGLRVDARLVDLSQWGSALLYFTGDKEHNISLRKIAMSRGWKLNEYGLFEGNDILVSKEEKDVYEKLGLQWIEPEKRSGVLPSQIAV